MMPDFLLIGAAKSGTTSLYHYLQQHPQIYMCPVNEPNFFALEQVNLERHFRGPVDREILEKHCVTDVQKYQALFASAPPEARCGENSPLYLYSEHAPARIKKLIPQVKLIAILRHPAERAYSNFQQYRRAGIEPLTTFEGALDAEEARIQQGWGPWPFWHYARVGFYAEQLRRYMACFPKEQIFVGLYDDLKANPEVFLQQIFGFIGVEQGFTPDISIQHNLSGQPRLQTIHTLATQPNFVKTLLNRIFPPQIRHSLRDHLHRWNTIKAPLRPETRARLIAYYREDMLQLQELIQLDLTHWLS